MAKQIEHYYDKPADKKKRGKKSENVVVIETKKDLVSKFNAVFESNMEFGTVKCSNIMVAALMYVFSTDTDPGDYYDAASYIEENIAKEDRRYFILTNRGKMLKRATDIMAELLADYNRQK